jgi:phosphotriesterase-related protein
MKRRKFLLDTSMLVCTFSAMPKLLGMPVKSGRIMTVLGPIEAADLGTTLVHEHVMADFIGAAETGPHRYNKDEVIKVVLPYLLKVKEAGCNTLVECTATFLGRDAELAKRLAEESGMHILTNTGNYAALGGKFVPGYAETESARELADRWIHEAENGIEGTGIFPGFIKIGVDEGPLLPIGKKLLEASARAHLETGLSISGHTGDGLAVMEELEILKKNGVDPSAFRWVHAQNENDKEFHLKAAKMGAYIEFDGIRADSVAEHVEFVKFMKENGFLRQTLISQDAGWYSVGEEMGGDFTPYTIIFDLFIPALRNEGFTSREVDQLLIANPRESLLVKVRKYKGS